jgi:hypothetical protein
MQHLSVFGDLATEFTCLVSAVALTRLILAGYVFTHFKFDFHVPGYNWRQRVCTMHFTELYQKFYDYTLNPNIPYAKHAISIDENRKDFKRVGWDAVDSNRPERDENDNIFFEQVWFAGNHADIGGGYEENESRLSDATLHWMVIAATAIPYPIKLDADVLKAYPMADGRLHNEVKSGFGLVTNLTGWTWTEQFRDLPVDKKTNISKAPMHKSVYQRFDLKEAFEYDARVPYRPRTLSNHIDFGRYYGPNAAFPATSLLSATALADDPMARKKKRSKKRRIR